MKLKVYRTAIGFHDAYVAATSQKAALKAWGSDKDLFARGVAETVADGGEAAKQALAAPGEVIKVMRGSAAEHLAALPKEKKPARKSKPSAPRPKPPPSRDALDAAEAALMAATDRHAQEERALEKKERALAAERKALTAGQRTEARTLEAARDAAEEAYRRALERWNG